MRFPTVFRQPLKNSVCAASHAHLCVRAVLIKNIGEKLELDESQIFDKEGIGRIDSITNKSITKFNDY